MTDEQRFELERMAVSTSLLHRQVVQARALLWAADGVANDVIGRRCEVDSDAVRRWRSRFAEQGVSGVGTIAKGRCRKGLPMINTLSLWVFSRCSSSPGAIRGG